MTWSRAINSIARKLYAQQLLDGLHVPVAVSLETLFSTAVTRAAVLRIADGVTTFDIASAPDPMLLDRALPLAILRSRELAITVPVVHATWRRWFSGDEECPASTIAACRALLREAARWGWHLDRVRPGADRLREDPEADVEMLFEEAVAEAVPAVGVRTSVEQHARAFDPQTGRPLLIEGEQRDVPAMMDLMREGFFWELGIYLTPATVVADATLGPAEFQVCWNDVVLPRASGLERGTVLVSTSATSAELAGFEAQPAVHPANGSDAAIVSGARAQELRANSRLTVWEPEGYLILAVSAAVRGHAGGLMTSGLADLYIAQVRRVFPRIAQVLTERLTSAQIARLFRGLLDEGISVRDVRTIGDAVAGVAGISTIELDAIVFQPATGVVYPAAAMSDPQKLQPADFGECARIALKRYISHKYTRGQGTLIVYLLERAFERRVAEVRGSPSDAEGRAWIDAVRGEVGVAPTVGPFPVILTSLETRRHFRRFIAREFPGVSVLSYQELSPDLNIQPIARIGVAG